MADHISRIYELLGADAVLLPVPTGTKGPQFKGWQSIKLADTQAEEYQAKLRGGNVGVLLGTPSGGLCAVDIDDDDLLDEFFSLNPGLRQTLISKGARGVQVWVRCKEDPEAEARGMDSWPKLYPLKFADRKVESGSTGEESLMQFGEWRSNGGQSIVWGRHPSGVDYSFVNEAPVREVYFREIAWPAGLLTPWEDEWLKRLELTYGEPWTASRNHLGELTTIKGMIEPYWAGRFIYHNHVLWEGDEERFYFYNFDNGCWERVSEQELQVKLADMLLQVSREMGLPVLAGPKFRSSSKLSTVLNWVKGYASKREIFKIKLGLVHLKNGMLDLTAEQPSLKPFSPYYYSRNQIPVSYRAGAECPKFMNNLLLRALPAEDVSLLQRWGGQLLLQKNVTQKFMIMTGAAGAGKSTLLEVIQLMIGEGNCEQLRTEQLLERFEIGSYVGATALFGADVPGYFLMQKGAYMIKSLTGGDLIKGEIKGASDKISMRGEFNIGITCNSRLKLDLNADAAAWARRLLIVPYNCEPPKEKIPDFAKWLFANEGAGILNWLIEGAISVLGGDRINLTERQGGLVQDLLDESDSVRSFLTRRVTNGERNDDITSEEMVKAYFEFCEARGWDTGSQRQIEQKLPDLMLEKFKAAKSNTVDRDSKAHRGWKMVKFIDEEDVIDLDEEGSN